MVAPAPNLKNILQKQVLASGDVASGCRVKLGKPMTVTRIFLSENVRVTVIGGIYPKLQWYYLVDFAEKH